jgi:predicted nucleotidyltransferase component of viral defense system
MTATAATFGVAEEQVRRDHLIGHILAALAEIGGSDLIFLGGTALSWTHLPDGRLSEDIDLLTDDRSTAADALEQEIPRRLRREFPGTTWDPGLRGIRSTTPARLRTAEGLVVRIQLLDAERQGWRETPTEPRVLVRRYRDVAETAMRVPTLTGFAMMKTLAWVDRHAARDLFDLAGLAALDALDVEAADLFRRSTGRSLVVHDFDRPPTGWNASLRHQTGQLPSALACLHAVRRAYTNSLGWKLAESQVREH